MKFFVALTTLGYSEIKQESISAKLTSKELGIDVILVSLLNPNYKQNLIKMATSIAQ